MPLTRFVLSLENEKKNCQKECCNKCIVLFGALWFRVLCDFNANLQVLSMRLIRTSPPHQRIHTRAERMTILWLMLNKINNGTKFVRIKKALHISIVLAVDVCGSVVVADY